MSNPWMKKNPFLSECLSLATRRAGSLRGQGTAQAEPDVVGVRDKLNSASSAVHVAALVMTALVVSACNKTPSAPPAPTTTPSQNAPVPTAEGAADTSVPDASSVLAPAAAVKVDPAAGRSNSAMSRAQESSAMPMPGQNNDHSAPLTPAKRASGI